MKNYVTQLHKSLYSDTNFGAAKIRFKKENQMPV